ncbi:L-tyrosine/L-tryptophan isonitrile synthase family protein [Saccharopolyspora sp. S2-29]|uniref:L-tyrosine/L-tryptophan isonitrile synthase family protein n=1 Tax=Saccharopolyspora mangrovi TaxID=3082379 RepID=A0ABU6AL74_9PSEU|nr:L-tyrosine/L-tryptophan isonitrile synthase family protein [Saccharopolyspora sp. S2-29]
MTARQAETDLPLLAEDHARDDRSAQELPAPGPWRALTVAEANDLLTAGGYGLWVERDREGGLLLAGVGTGIPLGSEATWADLYRALVRLRRTRRVFDAAWLNRLTGSLTPERTGSPQVTEVPAERVDLLSGEHRELAHRVLASLHGPGTGPKVPFPDARVTVGRRERAVRVQAIDSRDRALRELRSWERFNAVVSGDPELRMHCATQPVPGAVVDTGTGTTALLRVVDPAPAHPRHPGGTIAADLGALLHPDADGAPKLLRVVLDNRFARREDELDHFLEHFVRPLLRVFRLALDTHGLGLFALDETGFAVELSPELQATGRIVVTDHERITAEPSRAEVTTGVRALVSTLERLGDGFAALRADDRAREVRDAVRRVIGEELRYLAPHTAELLSGEQPLQSYAHTVPEDQDAVLKSVLDRVQQSTRERRWNPDAPRPAVVIDVDLCGLVPLQRITDAARVISGPRPGAPGGILELAGPATLPVLPTHVPGSWEDFVSATGLGERYPAVDWDGLRGDFLRAFQSRPRERLRTDHVNPGLARFVWDVQDAGGLVVFCTARKERFREVTAEVLAEAGVPDATLLVVADDATRPTAEVKAERIRALGGLDVVAVFDDEPENRTAVRAEFGDALPVAVEIPGLVPQRRTDDAAVIATFETRPSAPGGPKLSNTHSLEELQIGAMRRNRLARRWAVHLTEGETQSIVDSIIADTDRAALRTGRSAVAKFGLDERPDDVERVLAALHHVLTRKQFIKGSRANYRLDDLARDAEAPVRAGEPIDVVLLGFPVKQCLNRLKASGPLPDLAELGAMARLREMQRAVAAVHPPGLHFNILTDGRHFRSRPAAIADAYQRKLREYVDLVGIGDRTTVADIDEVAEQRLGPGLPAERSRRIANYRKLLSDRLRDFDITDNPLRTLEAVHDWSTAETDFAPHVIGLFREILMSLVYSVPVTVPPGTDRMEWSAALYTDIYNVTDPSASAEIRQGRRAVLRRAWHTVIRYMATMQVDDEFGYERMFPHRVRLTLSAVRHGCLGFTYLGGSGLLPWQGTGVLDPRGHVAIDFAISLQDQGFVPVYSPLLGPRQPWAMVPADRTHLVEPPNVPAPRGVSPQVGLRLDDEFARKARLRRK